jgi:DNA repair protein RadC
MLEEEFYAGVSPSKKIAVTILSMVERKEVNVRVEVVTVGLVKDAPDPESDICQPADVLPLLKETRGSDREHFICLHLDARNRVNSMETVSVGSLNATLVHPREVFKAAILNNAASIILAHNHPSNDTTPSKDDIELTRRMVKAGEIMGIEVLDHIIVGPDSFLSLREANVF